MVDTIAYRCFLALLPVAEWLDGWYGMRLEGHRENPLQRCERIIRHSLLGIRLFIRAGMVVKIEVDMPKLLYGHNGRLIKNQAELDRAFARLKQALQTICQLTAPGYGFYPGDHAGDMQTFYTRIDLVWQFDIVTAVVLNALRNAKHPEINKRKTEWRGETLNFPGTRLFICLYDKKAQAKARCEHNVFRAEVTLYNKKIDQHFAVAENNILTHLPIERAYVAYRNVLLGFGVVASTKSNEGGIEGFLAWACTQLPDLDVVGQYAQMKPVKDRQLGGLRRELGKRVLDLFGFSWANLLPADHLPSVVEVVDEAAEKKVDALFERLDLFAQGPADPVAHTAAILAQL